MNRFLMMSKEGKMRTAALAAGIILTVLGIASGEPALVLGKAVNICLECIGIG